MTNEDPDSLRSLSKESLRDVVGLANQMAAPGVQVVPGERWAFHYPGEEGARDKALQGLMSGTMTPDQAAPYLRPDALVYDVKELEGQGQAGLLSRIRDISSRMAHYDYGRFAEFVSGMKGSKLGLGGIQQLYEGISQSRTRQELLRAYGSTGRRDIEAAIRAEADRVMPRLGDLGSWDRILETLKMDWAHEHAGAIRSEQRDAAIQQLSGDERKIFDELRQDYGQYAKKGDQADYEALVKGMRQHIQGPDPTPPSESPPPDAPDMPPPEPADMPAMDEEPFEPTEEMQQVMDEIQEHMEDAGFPGGPDDPGIPPDDEDEYITPPTPPEPPPGADQGQQEKQKAITMFEITPSGTSTKPMGDYFCSGRKSYYDAPRKTWSKRKQLTPYSKTIQGTERQTISGRIAPDRPGGVTALPIPNQYGLDMSTFRSSGSVEVSRDQNGCFYLKPQGDCTFSVDFLAEKPPFVGAPIHEDLQPLYRGSLSGGTESFLSGLNSLSAHEKAKQAQRHILQNHHYPGGGTDLRVAQALQEKLRESPADQYIQNLDKSEYLECYSANTLFAAMMRKLGVPTRLVVGHMIDSAKDGKTAITDTTGHAWTEIWDGNTWVRYDATPPPKPEDRDPSEPQERGDDAGEGSGPMDKADDGGTEQPQQGESGGEQSGEGEGEGADGGAGDDLDSDQLRGQVQDAIDQLQQNLDQLPEASDSEMQQGEQAVDEAREEMQEMQEKQQEMRQDLQNADSAEDLKKLQDQIEEAAKDDELLQDMLDDLKERLDAATDQMKEELKEKLEEMADDGFLDEERRDQLEEKVDETDLDGLEQIQKEIDQESALFDQFEDLREEVRPMVEQWYQYFAERLPRQDEVDVDEDSLTRQGSFNRHSLMRFRNLILGTVKNPRVIRQSVKPKFMASIVLDVSGSMGGEKLQNALKMLVFYSELFNLISQEFGYIRFSIHIFSDSVRQIKGYDQDYDSPEVYDFSDGTSSTIKARLMKKVSSGGGTNMLSGVKEAAKALNEESWEYPDYASAMYFMGDGEDTCGNSANVGKFMANNDDETGFGEHMHKAIFMGNEAQRQVLANIFGDDHTTVAGDIDELVEESMVAFDEDITFYLENKVD